MEWWRWMLVVVVIAMTIVWGLERKKGGDSNDGE